MELSQMQKDHKVCASFGTLRNGPRLWCRLHNLSNVDAILQTKTPLIVATDSYSFCECLVKLGIKRVKRLIIDISAIREAYELRQIDEIVRIKADTNPADATTKWSCNGPLDKLMQINTN